MTFSGRDQSYMDKTLQGPAFFPALSLGEFQVLHRVPAHIAGEAVEQQLRLAMAAVNDALSTQLADWQTAGHATLADVDATDEGLRETRYRAAIYLRAKANLLTDFQTFSRRDQAENQAKESDSTRQRLLAESMRALRALQGKSPRYIDVELL